jgi:hypothetical protein
MVIIHPVRKRRTALAAKMFHSRALRKKHIDEYAVKKSLRIRHGRSEVQLADLEMTSITEWLLSFSCRSTFGLSWLFV